MKNALISFFILTLCLTSPIAAQKRAPGESVGSSAEEILATQAGNRYDSKSSFEDAAKNVRTVATINAPIGDYLMGPGDVVELTVIGIPGLDKKEFTLDGEGTITVPYVGQVELQGLTNRDAESKLTRLFSDSLVEDPQVMVNVKEYRSQYYYVMGAVYRPGRFPLTHSASILDALVVAGGLTDKAEPRVRIYRRSRSQKPDGSPANIGASQERAEPPDSTPSNPLEIKLPDLIENAQNPNSIPVLSGDVIEVPQVKDRVFYVLGDIPKPGVFSMPPNQHMALSQALANAGGLLKTASARKSLIIRKKPGEALPEQIPVDAYAALKGDIKDIDLLENDIVLVPGSASKTLGKTFMGGLNSFLTTLLVIGTRR
jgi:polysaccharide export outer membrane protein